MNRMGWAGCVALAAALAAFTAAARSTAAENAARLPKETPEQKAAFDGLQKMTVVKFASKYTGPLPTFDPTPFGGKRRLTLSSDGKTLQFKGYQGLFIVVQ